jgi:hypothetical protein
VLLHRWLLLLGLGLLVAHLVLLLLLLLLLLLRVRHRWRPVRLPGARARTAGRGARSAVTRVAG